METTERKRPNNYLAWSIVTCVLCCFPFSIPGIIQACKVNKLWDQQQYEEAEQAAAKAKKWCITSAIAGIVFYVLYFAFIMVLGYMVAKENNQIYY